MLLSIFIECYLVYLWSFTQCDATVPILGKEHADRSKTGLGSSDDDEVVFLARRVTVHHAGWRQRQHGHRRYCGQQEEYVDLTCNVQQHILWIGTNILGLPFLPTIVLILSEKLIARRRDRY